MARLTNPQQMLPLAKLGFEAQAPATWNAEMTQRSILLA
jgi:hypothetical protein